LFVDNSDGTGLREIRRQTGGSRSFAFTPSWSRDGRGSCSRCSPRQGLGPGQEGIYTANPTGSRGGPDSPSLPGSAHHNSPLPMSWMQPTIHIAVSAREYSVTDVALLEPRDCTSQTSGVTAPETRYVQRRHSHRLPGGRRGATWPGLHPCRHAPRGAHLGQRAAGAVFESAASISRLLLFDKRGTVMS